MNHEPWYRRPVFFHVAPAHTRRQVIAVFLLVLLYLADAVPRVLLYKAAAVPSTLLRAVLLVIEIAIFVGLSSWGGSSRNKQILGALLTLSACAAAVLVEAKVELIRPGSIYPTILYHKRPSFILAFGWKSTESLLRVATWLLVCSFPLKLEVARAKATEAANFQYTWAIERMRQRLGPAWVWTALTEISRAIEKDPHDAREQLANLSQHLDKLTDPDVQAFAQPLNNTTDVETAVVTPTLRAPFVRQKFVVAILTITCLFTLNTLAGVTEYGWIALRIDLLALVRIALEIIMFWVVAERASRRGIPVMQTIVWILGGSIALGLVTTLLQIHLETCFPGFFFPPTIYTHPTPPIRLFLRALTTAFVEVAFWTLIYLYPVASAEAAERTELALNLRRKAEMARLRATLAPHFVRNALNVIAGLVTEDPDEAQRLLFQLGQLLAELDKDEENHSLAHEMKWLRTYATLLEARHPDRLSFSFESDPRVEYIQVPRLLLQPLVENAVIHGALSQEGGGRVRVILAMGTESNHAVCTVEDNGPGMRRKHREGGVGIRLVLERLTGLSGGKLTIDDTGAGTRAVVELRQEKPS